MIWNNVISDIFLRTLVRNFFMNIFKKRLEACDFSIIIYSRYKSSCPEVFSKKGIPRNFAKFTGKHLCWSLFFNKVAGWDPQLYSKRGCSTGVFLWILPGLVSSGASLTSWEEGASLALAGHPYSNGVTIKMSYRVDVLYRPASHPIFSYWVG